MAQYKLGFIGGGAMAGAIISGVLKNNLVDKKEILVYDTNPAKLSDVAARYGVMASSSDNEVLSLCDMVVLAIKPQHFAPLEVKIKENRPIIVSIMAGVTINRLEDKFKALPIARIMPNVAAQVLESMSAICANDVMTERELDGVVALFEAVGKTVLVSEDQMDAVCGLSGSGPAYMFLILEAMADGGVKMGLNRGDAYKLAAQTMLGAAEMMLQVKKHPGVLKDMVTSPGGTTIQGIAVLEEKGVRAAMMQAVEAATLQSKKLGE